MSITEASDPWSNSSRMSDPFSDEDDSESVVNGQLEHAGDYSTHMEELFEGEDMESNGNGEGLDEEDEGDFVYNGIDADTNGDYKSQLRDVLGQDHDEEESEVQEVEKSLVYEASVSTRHDEPLQPQHDDDDIFFPNSPARSSRSLLTPDSRPSSPGSKETTSKLSKPFLHPTVSRLRSYTPQSSKPGSNASSAASYSNIWGGMSPSPSHFSSMSRMSSLSNLNSQKSERQQSDTQERTVFKWTDLQSITHTMYSKASQKASNLLGTPLLGTPTAMACNGLICIGTSEGKVVVHDFNQTLLCVCESNIPGNPLGPVSAVALSHDHTFIAAGHVSGYIQLYNLKQPHNPVRSVAPTTLSAIASGRKEGHLHGSKIVSIGFIAGRHTALVSADEHGLAFFHSLGKILFVEAPDILRILGRYPDPPAKSLKTSAETPKRSRYTILSMASLPLGTAPHPTDNYNAVALLTPTKLVVVGLKPSPRTWFKCPRDVDEGGSWKSRSKWIGCLAWFPSFLESTIVENTKSNGKNHNSKSPADFSTHPVLVYSWGSSLHLVKVKETRIKQTVQNPKTGKHTELEVGTITHEEIGKWKADEDILALQWLNHNQIIVICRNTLGVYDMDLRRLVENISFNGISLISQVANSVDNYGEYHNDVVGHSVRTYKGKIFLLKQDKVVAGTLLTWADLVLALVERGEFLKAIDLTRSYYLDQAPGNRNNLPLDPVQRKAVIGDKLRNLLDASAQYAFSEDRMTDDTHSTPDNRGVDRTSLFEGLVNVCCKTSIALDDFEYLYEDLFQRYDDSGIAGIYLRQLEPFVLQNEIRYVPPRITQRLIALHEEDGRPEHIERIIWHMDASCLDLDQTIQLCQEYHLYDALVYIYTRAMRDYVAPIVEFLGLIRKVQQFRKKKKEYLRKTGMTMNADSSMESTIINVYKVYPYLADVLSGLTYPSEEPLDDEEATQAKRDVYTFLFFGRSSVWPPGESGKLILTSDEDGGVEPTYPYARLLLMFDSESFLHSLDIAFEDVYLNDENQAINRLFIVRILLEILASDHLPQEDVTMINIFIARNAPKYPQFLFHIAPSTLHDILIGLGEDPDPQTREDRQLAAEYLLSAYNPHDSEEIITLFENAGFYRILRSWHYHERRWTKLLSTYIIDPSVTSLELISRIEEVLRAASRVNRNIIPNDLLSIVADSLPRLLRADIAGIAHLFDTLAPELHEKALDTLKQNTHADEERFEYLSNLMGIHSHVEDDAQKPLKPSDKLSDDLRNSFFDLQCRFSPGDVISTLRRLPKEILKMDDIIDICESRQVYDAVIWATDHKGNPRKALSKANTFQTRITHELLEAIKGISDTIDIDDDLISLQKIAQTSRNICIEHSRVESTIEVPLEDMWFELLSSEIHNVQYIVSSFPTNDQLTPLPKTVETLLTSLRFTVQTTFSALVSITSTSTISFPRLFKRLVNATPSASGSQYTEFRMILTGMLESYRSDEDNLNILKHLMDRDLFDTVALASHERACGWIAPQGICRYCRKALANKLVDSSQLIIVSRAGFAFHERCQPPHTTRPSDI